MYDIPMPMHQDRELPMFTLRQIDLPEIASWIVNGEYYIVMKVKMVSKRSRQDIEAPEDKEKIEGARKKLTYAIIGFIVVLSSFLILNIVSGFFGVDYTP